MSISCIPETEHKTFSAALHSFTQSRFIYGDVVLTMLTCGCCTTPAGAVGIRRPARSERFPRGSEPFSGVQRVMRR